MRESVGKKAWESGAAKAASRSDIDPSSVACATLARRDLLRHLLMGLGAAGLPSWWSSEVFAAGGGTELDIPLGPLGAQDFGPLEPKLVGDNLSGVDHQLLAPAGFDVRVVMRAGVNPVSLTSSGVLGHPRPDGGAVFPSTADGGWVYVSNSEYVPGGAGALRFAANGTMVDYRRILEGSIANCAGGATPWGTWLSCEEIPGGHVFECLPFGTAAQAVRKDALGARNSREAAAIDPVHNVCYQTLDEPNGKFVRFVSNPDDLVSTPEGITRMKLESGVSQRLRIPAFGDRPGYDDAVVPNDATGSARLREARPIQWVADTGSNGTNFNGAEGLWYYELPPALRTTPAAGTVPTRGVVFFATKLDNRIWAIDIENSLIELIYDTHNNQGFPNLRPGGSAGNYNQVDNLVVSPMGDVLVAEDGDAMRLAIIANNQPPKLLMQITRGGSEICGPAFTPDGSRLYFSSQRGPSGASGTDGEGLIYEMTIPPRFRGLQVANAFSFPQLANVAPGAVVTSAQVTVTGFSGALTVTVNQVNNAQYSVNGGTFTNVPGPIQAGQTLRVRHTASVTSGAATETTVSLAGRTSAIFRSVTMIADRSVAPFSFGTRIDVAIGALLESMVITPNGFNTAIPITPGARMEYRVNGGAYTAAAGTLMPGQTLQVRHTASTRALTYTRTSLKLGDVVGTFTTRTGRARRALRIRDLNFDFGRFR